MQEQALRQVIETLGSATKQGLCLAPHRNTKPFGRNAHMAGGGLYRRICAGGAIS